MLGIRAGDQLGALATLPRHHHPNLDPALTDRVGPSGRTPKAALAEQLEALRSAAEQLLHAAQEHDVDALFTQGSLLRTKFTGRTQTISHPPQRGARPGNRRVPRKGFCRARSTPW